MKKIVLLMGSLIIFLVAFVGCEANIPNTGVSGDNIQSNSNNKSQYGGQKLSDTEKKDYTEIKFSDMYETKGNEKNVSMKLQDLNGKKVVLKGYPAVQSPLDESFLYLNNQPYVTCPFCTLGDITKLEVIPVYMANGNQIKYTEDGLVVYGKLEVEEKLDSEGYTTQFRIYADSIEIFEASDTDKNVQAYYQLLTEQGMIYDIQTLQINIEYASNPDYMSYYGENKRDIVNGIINEYVGYDEYYKQGGGEDYTYITYIMECPEIVKSCEPEDEKLKKLNDELIQIYQDQILVLNKYSEIVYKYYGKELTDAEIEVAYKEFTGLNAGNLKLYNRFTAWNNKLRE